MTFTIGRLCPLRFYAVYAVYTVYAVYAVYEHNRVKQKNIDAVAYKFKLYLFEPVRKSTVISAWGISALSKDKNAHFSVLTFTMRSFPKGVFPASCQNIQIQLLVSRALVVDSLAPIGGRIWPSSRFAKLSSPSRWLENLEGSIFG